ncbi:MAG: DUF5667 domain-containing protein [Dehalococcoidales bacterium]|nr:DUF5667 domain-containing protein [Dehalococcoidales bacterium]
MKKLLLILPVMAGLASLPFGNPLVYAQDDQHGNLSSVEMGIFTDSHFYFLDNLGKTLSLLFTIGQDAKTQKSLAYSDERLAEAMVMAEQNKTESLIIATRGYEHFIAIPVKQADNARQVLVTDLDEEVAAAIAVHLEYLDSIEDQLVDPVPQDTVDFISTAKESSIKGLTSVLQGLALDKPLLSAEIGLKTAEGRLSRAKALALRSNSDELQKAVQEGEELFAFGPKIAEAAKQFNSGAAAVEASIARKYIATSIRAGKSRN